MEGELSLFFIMPDAPDTFGGQQYMLDPSLHMKKN